MIQEIKEHTFFDNFLRKEINVIDRMYSLGFESTSKPISYLHNSDNYDVLFYKKPKVGILYICTGKYVQFLEDFITTSNEYLLPLSNKKYFIFTDAEFQESGDGSINIIPQPKLGYDINTDTSYDSLMRYHIFLKHKDLFEDLDYLVFFNANTKFIKHVEEQYFLPNEINDGLVSVHHSGHYIMENRWDGYDENKLSISFIPINERTKKYCQGALIGGKTKEFLDMCEIISKNIDKDLSNNIHPKSWDEPYMNRYLFNKNPLILHPGYSFPDNPDANHLMSNIEKFVYQLDKNKLGGHNFLKS